MNWVGGRATLRLPHFLHTPHVELTFSDASLEG